MGFISCNIYSKTCLKRPLKKKTKIAFQDRLSLNAGPKYCRMLIVEHSAILSTFIKLPFVIKIFVFSIFEWPLKTGFTVPHLRLLLSCDKKNNIEHSKSFCVFISCNVYKNCVWVNMVSKTRVCGRWGRFLTLCKETLLSITLHQNHILQVKPLINT